MSNTIVTNYSNASGKSTNADKSLVILVNKDGSVSLEKDTIQSLIENQYDNTTVSIVRMNDDGKPEDASDHSSDEIVPHINVTVDAFFDSFPNEDDKESHNDYVSDLFGSEIPLIGFQNDHCYTPLTSPSQSRRNSDCDPVVYKDEIGHNTQKSYIPNSKKITVLENKIIAKGKNVQYYHPGGAREILKGSDLLKRPISAQNLQLVRKIEADRHQLKSSDSENILNKRLLDVSKHEAFNSEHGSDHSTLIINQDGNVQSVKKSLLKKDVKKILSRKIELKNNGLANSSISLDHEQNVGNRNKKVTKSYSTQKIVDEKGKSYILKSEFSKGGDGMKQTLLLNSKLNNSELSKEPFKSEIKLDTHKNQQKSVLKKDKKAPAHMTALFNDINSLFSSPDVIRRVSTDSKTPDQLSGNLLKKADLSFSTSDADKINADLLNDPKVNQSKLILKSHTNVSTNNKNLVRSMSDVSSRRHKNQKEGLDIISPFDDESLVQLLQETTNSEILSPSNIPLDIGPVTVQTSMLDKHDANPINSNSVLISPNSLAASGLNAPLSPSLDLLGGLHPEEEGLPEDLLRHVAQLVESSENLQEVIDKEVLGKVNIHSKDSMMKQISQSGPPLLTKIEHNVQSHHLIPEVEKQPNSQNLIRKEPIQIVRSNGRVITLPPIEAPATRSSKRKSLMNSVEINPGVSNPDLTKVTPNVLTPAKQPINTYSRSHKASESKTPQIPNEKKDEDAESDESWNSEDDPDRLWCVCKQPHNNRFMICCDSCEDWFHGKCVNVTKAMGQEMEEKGIEWRCPSCVKKKGLANPSLKSLTSLRKSTEARVDERASRLSTDNGSAQDSNTSCIVCKKPARTSSIYCGDACILKHAQESLTLTSVVSAKNVRDNTLNKLKPETRVIVIERKTGNVLAGPNAPTTSNLKTWLQEHPTYEVVQPGTNIIKSSPNITKIKAKSNSPKFLSILTMGQDKQQIFVSSALKSPPAGVKLAPKTVSPNSPSNLKSPPSLNRPQTPKTLVKSPPPVKVQTPQLKPTPLKSPTPSTSQKREETIIPQRYSNSTEPIRDNVKKTLCEEISKRMAESKDVKFTHEEILKFSTDTEYELHDLFKDVGAKYKVKYRSLMFNLKDRKNLTLWQKICDRSITPKQLVRLSPEELASQELAQWRDKEVKHQLELIKKSELDLLACNKTYVLKTHKGEEVMESRTTGTAELDPNVSVEDLVSALNKSVDNVGNSIANENKQSSPVPSRDKGHSSHHKHSRHKSKSSKSSKSSSSKGDHSSKHESSSSKHKSSKDSRSDSRSHHRKSSRERSRKSSNSRRHSESSRHSTHSKSSRNDDKKRSSDNRRSSSSSKDDRNSKETDYKKDVNEIKMDIIGLENIRSPVLYDTKGDDEIGNDLLSPNSDSLKSPVTPEIGVAHKIIGNTESDQEPSSTVDSMIWNGIMNMIDVARFSVTAHEVSGQCDDIIQELESELEVVGRIGPDTVWDYISKMKKQGYNDISVLRFIAAADEDKSRYMTLYTYLSTRSRLGVIRGNIGAIKDFYVLPLSSQAPLPSVLLPLQGPGFEESRPNLLLGIIVKQRRKRVSHFPTLSAIPSKISKLANSDRSYTSPTDGSYTPPPPSSPKRKASSTAISGMPLPSFLPSLSSTVRDKIAASLASAGDDEPYSPGGSDSGSLERSHSPSVKQSTSDDLHKKMEELTRKIEEEKKQIENIAVTISGDSLDEPYSPSRPMSPSSVENPLTGLSSISLPSNLQEILASIQKKTKAPNNELTDSQGSTEPYIPQAVLNATASVNPYFKESFSGDVDMRMINTSGFPPQMPNFARNQVDTAQKSTSKLSTLSEAELLSMVPDDEVLLPSNKINPVYPPLPNLPPPSLVTNTSIPPPPFKRQKLEYGQPPPPGFEDL